MTHLRKIMLEELERRKLPHWSSWKSGRLEGSFGSLASISPFAPSCDLIFARRGGVDLGVIARDASPDIRLYRGFESLLRHLNNLISTCYRNVRVLADVKSL